MIGASILIGILAAIATMGLIAWLWIALARAPYGREDSDGFHFTDEQGNDLP